MPEEQGCRAKNLAKKRMVAKTGKILYRIKYKDGVEKCAEIPKGDGLIPRNFLA